MYIYIYKHNLAAIYNYFKTKCVFSFDKLNLRKGFTVIYVCYVYIYIYIYDTWKGSGCLDATDIARYLKRGPTDMVYGSNA